MKPNNHYTKSYFIARDILDLHLADTIEILVKKNHAHVILDIGCGSGQLVKHFRKKGFMAIGLEPASPALRLAAKNKSHPFIQGSAAKLPLKSNSIDIITNISVIEHLTDQQVDLFLREACRILKPGGIIFLVTPNFGSPIRLLHGKRWFAYQDPTHITYFTRRSLGKRLKATGFDTIQLQFQTSYATPYDWDLPPFLHRLPIPIRNAITFLLISSPLSFIRNSFWIAAKKPQ